MQTKTLTPSYDNYIYKKYSKNTIKNKIENKLGFQHEFGLLADRRTPLCCVTVPLGEENNGKLLEEVINGILTLDMQLALLGVGTEKYKNFLTQLADEHPHRIKIIPESKENIRKIYAASDLGLILKKNSAYGSELTHYLYYAVVPVCPIELAREFKIRNYHPATEEGEGFVYDDSNVWNVFSALVRARETYYFPYDWQHIQRSCMDLLES